MNSPSLGVVKGSRSSSFPTMRILTGLGASASLGVYISYSSKCHSFAYVTSSRLLRITHKDYGERHKKKGGFDLGLAPVALLSVHENLTRVLAMHLNSLLPPLDASGQKSCGRHPPTPLSRPFKVAHFFSQAVAISHDSIASRIAAPLLLWKWLQ